MGSLRGKSEAGDSEARYRRAYRRWREGKRSTPPGDRTLDSGVIVRIEHEVDVALDAEREAAA